MRKIKRKILKFLTGLNFFLFLIGLCSIDSSGIYYYISLALTIIPGLWLLIFYLVNHKYIERKYEIWQ